MLVSAGCGQDSKLLCEHERILYELSLYEVNDSSWKREIHSRGTEELKFFTVQNILNEDGWIPRNWKIVKKSFLEKENDYSQRRRDW